MSVCMATTKTVKWAVGELETAGCKVVADWTIGTIKVTDGDIVVYQAIQKGPGQPWIVRYCNGPTFRWREA